MGFIDWGNDGIDGSDIARTTMFVESAYGGSGGDDAGCSCMGCLGATIVLFGAIILLAIIL